MSLIQDIRKDMFNASKQGDTNHADILKMVIADIQNEEKSLGKEISDEESIKIIRKQVKKIKDSITEFEKMNRDDLISKEKAQLEVLEKYLPALMSKEDIKKVVEKAIKDTGATSIKDMGKVMGASMKELEGKAEGNTVKDIVQSLLS